MPLIKEFYLIVAPGVEELAKQELLSWFPQVQPEEQHGGILVKMPLKEGLSMNQVLKIPTRVLMRVESFKCRDFPKLFQKISKYPWDQVIDPTLSLEVHASSSKSRLSIKKRIKQTGEAAWRAFQKKSGVITTSGNLLGLYVRIHEDICTLSLDTSGERLHKRGEDKHIGQAPLRETLAAAMIEMIGLKSEEHPVEIVDPMLGSGTLLSEALLKDRTIQSRKFAWSHFKCEPIPSPQQSQKKFSIEKLIGYEQDLKTFKAARFNLEKLACEDQLQLFQEDFFKAKPLPSSKFPRWVVCNPPYGERLQVIGSLKEFYERLFQQIEKICGPERVCILLPSRPIKGKLKLPPCWKVSEKRKTSNGGIPIDIYLFARTKYS